MSLFRNTPGPKNKNKHFFIACREWRWGVTGFLQMWTNLCGRRLTRFSFALVSILFAFCRRETSAMVYMFCDARVHQVFSTFCSKLMGSLFQLLPAETTLPTAVASPTPLYSAATTLVCETLFHEEHLDGYREAFMAAEAAGASHSATVGTGAAADPAAGGGGVKNRTPPAANESGGKNKRRRKNNGGRIGGDAAADSGSSGGKNKTPGRACYQQQLLDNMATLSDGGSHVEQERSRLGAIAGAPLLLEGYITRLGKAQQHEAVDIHEATGTSMASAAGGKRSRGGGGGTGSPAPSPASQMFRLWVVLTSTLSGSLKSASRSPPQAPSSSLVLPLLLLPYLRSSNSMLRLLADHDVYRINEDWGGLEFDELRSFSASLIRLAAAADDVAGIGGGCGDMTDDDGPRTTASATATSAGTGAAGRSLGSQDDVVEGASTGAAQEFLKAFASLLGLNHNILHDDLRPVLRMTLGWFATAEAGAAAAAEAAETVATAGGGSDLRLLRGLAIGLVVSLVDTYGRLRQMDHLVRALFDAILDMPSAAAAVLRKDECTTALGR